MVVDLADEFLVPITSPVLENESDCGAPKVSCKKEHSIKIAPLTNGGPLVDSGGAGGLSEQTAKYLN